MNARIDITTKAGQSLEGFPQNYETWRTAPYIHIQSQGIVVISTLQGDNKIKLHPGDKITIEIL